MTLAGLAGILRRMGEAPVLEHRFAPWRRWKFDLALPSRGIALEVEGGAWTQGRHTRGSGFVKDMAKYNCAAAMGWRVIRVVPEQVDSGEALRLLDALLAAPGAIGDGEARLLFPAPDRRKGAKRRR